jgi:hypothetical protein
MSRQTTDKKDIYNQQIRSLFTQLICETESLYEKVTSKIKQDSQPIKKFISN